MTNLVSILIPAYNMEKLISQTIESALGQTWSKKEIIIVDDGSLDNTLQIAKSFESKIVKVVTQDNKGASAARNTALSLAQGEYIQWLDSDDLLAPDKITQQLRNSDSGDRNTILLSSSYGTFYFQRKKAKFKPNSLWQDLEPIDWLINKLNDNVWMPPCVMLVSRKLTDMSGPWNEKLFRNNDGEYFDRVVATCEKIRFIPEAKSYYRIGNFSSISSDMNLSEQKIESLFMSICLTINNLLSLEDSDRTRAACLKYLQTWLIYFYPEKPQLKEKLYKIADGLGGELKIPQLSFKYRIIKKTFDWKSAKSMQVIIPSIKNYTLKNWDRILYMLTLDCQK